jgi:MFS family permease
MVDHNETTGLSRRNFTLGVVNGGLFILMASLVDTDTVLTGFAWQLTGGKTLWIGLLVSVINSGWFWPSLFLSPYFATLPRLMPWYRITVATRLLGLFAMTAVAWEVGSLPLRLGFVLFTLTYLIYTASGGISLIPFMSIIADTIPAHWRGRFFGWRYLTGGLAAFFAGFAVKWLLSEHSPYAFPTNYALLFTVAAGLAVPSLLVFCFAEEPPQLVKQRRVPMGVEIRRGLRLLQRDRNFKRLIVTRSLATLMLGLALPFIVPYSLAKLGAPFGAVGIFMSAKVLTYALSNVLWSRVSDRRGNRRLLLLSAVLGVAAVWLLLVVHLLPDTILFHLGQLGISWRVAFVCLIFAAFGFSNAGQEIGYTNFLLELIPERKRPTYLGVYYLIWAPLCWVPFLGALLIGSGNHFTLGFVLAAVVSLVMLRYTFRLKEVRDLEVSAVQTSAWRRAQAWVNGGKDEG